MTDVIAELGHLKKLATQDPQKRFDRLYRLLRQSTFLVLAQERIARNTGANTPGVDGQTMADLTSDQIIRLHEELTAGTYQPQPVRRVYIPKRNGKLRPLGIPASRDKIVQAGVALILEALYEPIFRNCSNGFRPGRSPLTAIRQLNSAYRTGATWIIEGDITDCFGSIPHGVILNCLRKRICDERFIDLIRQMLQAGAMESGRFATTYSGTPQGGIASPLLANIVLHELDTWLETQRGVNPPSLTTSERNAQSNLAYMRLHHRMMDIQRYLDGKRPIPQKTTPEQLRHELRELIKLRRRQPRSLPRTATFYSRYADDFVVVMCHAPKTEAEQLKAKMADWMHAHLGLTLHPDKTQVTHWREPVRFLGYELEGRTNPNGTGWLHLGIPKSAVRSVVDKIQQATRYTQAPEYDVFLNVNAIARGWTNYYRYAHNNNSTGGKLSQVIFWRTAHYLGKRQHASIAKVMRDHYTRDPQTGCKALYTYRPGSLRVPEYRYFIWHKTPTRLQLGSGLVATVQDKRPYLDAGWARGRSQHKKWETRAKAERRCEECGATGVMLYVHHPNRLAKAQRVKKGMGHVAQSGMEQRTKLLCRRCHLNHHHYASS